MNVHLEALANNVRRLREAHGLSLSQLSERSGVAKATLFKVERGRTNPTLDTISAIAETFDVQLPTLISAPPKIEVDVVRIGEGEDISDDASDGRVLRSQVIGAGSMEVHSQTFFAGKSSTSASHGAGAREHVFVCSGSIRVGPVGHEEVLNAGEYGTYPADRPHRWTPIDGPASVWIVHTFPRAVAFSD